MLRLFKAYLPVIFFVILVVLFFRFVIQISLVPSESMVPTISEKTVIIGSRINEPKKNDIIIFEKGGIDFVKRVIAVGGEKVEIKNNAYYIDGKKEKNKIKEKTKPCKDTKFAVPRDCFFVSGDNRGHSVDSRFWKEPFVNKKDVKSVVVWKGW